MPIIIFSAQGGMDIEEVAAKNPEQIAKVIVDPLIGLQNFHCAAIFKQTGVTDPVLKEQIKKVITGLYSLFNDYDLHAG